MALARWDGGAPKMLQNCAARGMADAAVAAVQAKAVATSAVVMWRRMAVLRISVSTMKREAPAAPRVGSALGQIGYGHPHQFGRAVSDPALDGDDPVHLADRPAVAGDQALLRKVG